jgi:cytochrome c oxidase subunit III
VVFKVKAAIGGSTENRANISGNGHQNGLHSKRGGGGDSGESHDGGDDNSRDESRRFSPLPYRIGIAAVLAAITMTFGALTIIYLSRVGGAFWQPIEAPRLLWISTVLIVLSSIAFEIARRRLHRAAEISSRRWLIAAIALGAAFISVQLAAWRELGQQGVFLAENPHRTFFYLLTLAHAVHLVGGIIGACYLLFRLRFYKAMNEAARARREALMSTGAIYWHSMDALWIYVFALLFLWR